MECPFGWGAIHSRLWAIRTDARLKLSCWIVSNVFLCVDAFKANSCAHAATARGFLLVLRLCLCRSIFLLSPCRRGRQINLSGVHHSVWCATMRSVSEKCFSLSFIIAKLVDSARNKYYIIYGVCVHSDEWAFVGMDPKCAAKTHPAAKLCNEAL